MAISPRLARQRLPWVNVTNRKQPQRGCGESFGGDGSFPNVFLIPFNLVLVQQRALFVLEARSFHELRKVTRAQIRKGSYSNEGYKFVPEIGISIQGVDADHAWEYSLRLAIHVKVPVKAEIEWRNNDKAAHPGERGVMVWTP